MVIIKNAEATRQKNERRTKSSRAKRCDYRKGLCPALWCVQSTRLKEKDEREMMKKIEKRLYQEVLSQYNRLTPTKFRAWLEDMAGEGEKW